MSGTTDEYGNDQSGDARAEHSDAGVGGAIADDARTPDDTRSDGQPVEEARRNEDTVDRTAAGDSDVPHGLTDAEPTRDAGTDGPNSADGSGSGTGFAAAPGTAQDAPAMDQHTTNDDERIRGIVEQTRADLAGKDDAEIERVVRQRLEQAGIDLDDDGIAAAARG